MLIKELSAQKKGAKKMNLADLKKKAKGVTDVMSGKIITDKLDNAINKTDLVVSAMLQPDHVTTADDFSGDLTCPVSVCLLDYFEDIYGEIEPEKDPSNYDEADCCAECGKPFVLARSYFQCIIQSVDKEQNKLIKKDKDLNSKYFCCPDCATKFFEKKFPGVFVTEDRNQYDARLMALRKDRGEVSFADKMANKVAKDSEKANEIFLSKLDEKRNRNPIADKLGILFPFLKNFMK